MACQNNIIERILNNPLPASRPTRHGVQADVRIGAPAAGSPRGVLAERDFGPQEVILSLPKHLTVSFEGTPEEACVLLLHIKHDRQKQQHYRPWLATLPGPEDFIPWDQLDDEALSLLQSPEMVGDCWDTPGQCCDMRMASKSTYLNVWRLCHAGGRHQRKAAVARGCVDRNRQKPLWPLLPASVERTMHWG